MVPVGRGLGGDVLLWCNPIKMVVMKIMMMTTMMTLVMTKVEWVDKREPNWFWLNFALLVVLGTSLITLHSLFSFN